MEVTNIQVKLRSEEKLKGFVDVTFDDCFVVRGCRIIQSSTGYFVAMPSQKKADGTHRDIAHRINAVMRQRIEDSVIKAYVTELRSRGEMQLTGGEAVAQQASGSERATRLSPQEEMRGDSQGMEQG